MKTSDTILVLDFGSQYTQLIARRVREQHVFSKIVPFNISIKEIKSFSCKGIILSGGPDSIYERNTPLPDKAIFKLGIPILGICYGMQVITQFFGGKVKQIKQREYGRTEVFVDDIQDIFYQLPGNFTCWMSHGDSVVKVPKGFKISAHTLNNIIAAISCPSKKIYGVQFHPEVSHTSKGTQIIANFLFRICRCYPSWTMQSFIKESVEDIRKTVGKKKVILGLSGGIDSSVCAVIVHKAIGKNLRCIFIDNGLLRKNEGRQVRTFFTKNFKINLKYIDRSKIFLQKLKRVTDPEEKRKVIGEEFIKIFEDEARKFRGVEFLAQGTLYPDVIESGLPTSGPSSCIKSHHNVGGIPLNMKLKLIEPLKELFKDEVRELACQLDFPQELIWRQPFPGPGLAIRIIGEVTEERLRILREADERLIEEITKANLYEQMWQTFAILLPIKTVGVMGDRRTYEYVIAIRCVESKDGMTADWARLPYEVLQRISSRIIGEVKGINRVVYDITTKPPATIEWE
ncbi:MAG: glutamine-hydrolyzing GMP synthase [Candidatus Omnitrophica bacterium]|nr:glutamine-hydrolyzing GMP synthase [Candidatus Omnitrophota bacterium]